MNNYAILGPNKVLNKSLKKRARELVHETINRNWFRDAYKMSNRDYGVFNTEGLLVGFALINKNHKNLRGDMRIRLIGTNKGRGIGRLLMEHILNNAKGRGLKTVTLESVPEARGFYTKIGFLPIGIGNNMRFYLKPSRRKSPSRPSPARPAVSRAPSARPNAPRQTPRR